MKFRELKLRKNPNCPVCGENPSIKELIDYEEFCGIGQEDQAPTGIEEITAKEFKEELDEGKDLFILDVRNPVEFEICRIDGSHLIPLDELLNRIHELDSARDIVVHCRSGARSAQAIEMLREAGFRKLRNLKGGVLAWSDDVDPTMPKY
jgi:adenylyltransferase/sulfurtransferase